MKKLIILGLITFYIGSEISAQDFQRPGCSSAIGQWMLKKKDTLGDRGVGDNYHIWDNGTVLKVKFMAGGSKELRNKVMQYAKEWEKHSNLTFNFLPDNTGETDIRIKLGKGFGHNSLVGTESRFRNQNEQTMNFDTLGFVDVEYYKAAFKKKGMLPPYTFQQFMASIKDDPNHWLEKELKRVVMHEFGHAIGLLHEQSYPGKVNWKKTDSVYKYYRDTQGWDKAKVDFNVFEMSNQFYTNGTAYDPKSIMHYSIAAWQTTDGFSMTDNYELSSGDKSIISALYPKGKKESDLSVPKVDVTNVGQLKVVSDLTRNGLVITPSFDVKTNSKIGEVYFVARLVGEDGYFLKTYSDYYNWGGYLATYRKIFLQPNKKVSYNKSNVKNLELFIPFDKIPELEGKKFYIAFFVYLNDVKNQQLDKVMYFSTTSPLSLPR